MKLLTFFIRTLCITLIVCTAAWAQSLDYEPKILLVTAHPDDDAIYAATVFKTTHLLNGKVDLAVLTNGEGGYTYSTIGSFIYNRQLDKEEVGREYLPGIRKQEVMAGGDIVGIRNYFFFDQVDDEFSLDVSRPLESWNVTLVKSKLKQIIKREGYDFLFTMMPVEDTHAHHKASALLALQSVNELDASERPIVLSTTILREKSDTTTYTQLEGHPITEINRDIAPFHFDRTQTFGHNNRLNYNIIANWVIAEHKSQGTMQLFMNGVEVEEYWYYSLNPEEEAPKVRAFFETVNAAPMYSNPNDLPEDGG